MQVANVSNAVDSGYSTLAGALLLPKDAGLASTLTLGQTLKGKVLMRHERDRYTVLFANREYVVHSDIKLVIDEVIETKVVAIKEDFVHLKKAHQQPTIDRELSPDIRTSLGLIDRVANNYGISVTKADAELIQRVGGQGNIAHLIATAKLLLFIKKIGLVPTREIMDQFVRHFQVKQPVQVMGDIAADSGFAPDLLAAEPNLESLDAAKQIQLLPGELKDYIRSLFDSGKQAIFDGDEGHAPDSSGTASKSTDARSEGRHQNSRAKLANKLMLRNLLNVQTETMLAHKYVPIAFLFDDQLIEIDLAVFFPRRKVESGHPNLLYAHNIDHTVDGRDIARGFTTNNHRLTFALETQSLGKMHIQVHVTNRRLNVDFALSDDSSVEQFIASNSRLKSQFEGYGWQLDEAKYRVQEEGETHMSFTKRAVVEHYILAGSLSRLI